MRRWRRHAQSDRFEIAPHHADDAARERFVGRQELRPDHFAAIHAHLGRARAMELEDVAVVFRMARVVHELGVVGELFERRSDAHLFAQLAARGLEQRLAAHAPAGRKRQALAVRVLDHEHALAVPHRDVRAVDRGAAQVPPRELEAIGDAQCAAPEPIEESSHATARLARSKAASV